MRLFGSDRIAKLMDRLGLKEGEVIQHSMISKSIERAQKKVEENNFGIRKRLLEYDDVMNSQREVIYTKRRHALYGERMGVDISNMLYDVVYSVVNQNHGNVDFEEFKYELIRTLSIEAPFDEAKYLKSNENDLVEEIYAVILEKYKRKSIAIAEQAFPVIKDVYEKSSHIYTNIIIPFSDGRKTFQVLANLKKSYETNAKDLVLTFEKASMLATIDESWKEHLREMDDLKQSVQNASYEQKDPLLIYKFESFELFQKMIDQVNKDITSTLMKGHIQVKDSSEVKEGIAPKKLDMSKYKTDRADGYMNNQKEEQKTQPIRVEKKVGRNDECPCGSGKKYKNCHGVGQE
jgi:preprotein translocase subunit SecA